MTTAPASLSSSFRESLQMTGRSLESIYDKTTFPFALISWMEALRRKPDANLEGQARARGFRLVRTERHLTAGFSSVMTCLRAREASAPVRPWGSSVGGVRSVSSGRATSFPPVILFFSASRMCPVRTR